jgi:F-type H+-transporting ATPase subunit gamma
VKREADLKRRLRSLEALSEAVGAMKSLSAHHFREARAALEAARLYREGVERILAGTGAALGAGTEGAGLLVIGGELGLCGAHNARAAAAGAERRAELGRGPTLCVGHRAGALLARRGVAMGRVYAAPTSVHGITEVLLRLAEDVLTLYVDERLSSFEVLSNRFGGVGVDRSTAVRLLPLESKRAEHPPPARYGSPDHLASAAAREFLYAFLDDLLLDALASENGARLVATQSAEKWLDERTERLRRRIAAAHREASTQEMIEIAAGARARERVG